MSYKLSDRFFLKNEKKATFVNDIRQIHTLFNESIFIDLSMETIENISECVVDEIDQISTENFIDEWHNNQSLLLKVIVKWCNWFKINCYNRISVLSIGNAIRCDAMTGNRSRSTDYYHFKDYYPSLFLVHMWTYTHVLCSFS